METAVKRVLSYFPALLAHFLVAVVGGMLIGFLPEALLSTLYYNTGLEPYSPAIAVSAFLLGYFVGARTMSVRAAPWTWTQPRVG